MIVPALIAVLLFLTPVAGTPATGEQNVFVALGTEHCAEEIAVVIFENTGEEEIVPNLPGFVTYAAFDFNSAEQASAALDEAPLVITRDYLDGSEIDTAVINDELITEVPTADYGDRSVAYAIPLPTGEEVEVEDVPRIEMLGIVQETQLLLAVMYSEGLSAPAVPGVALETVPPLLGDDDLEERWDGTGDVQDLLPDEEDMPVDWVAEEVTIEELPPCNQQGQ